MENETPHIKPRKSTSFRLSADGAALLSDLATRLGMSQSAVIELAIRELAKREGLR